LVLGADTTQVTASPALTVECPHCQTIDLDDFEVLSAETVTRWRCSGCCREFRAVAIDCESCWSPPYAHILGQDEALLLGPRSHLSCRCCGRQVACDPALQAEDLAREPAS
jgi:hypothetical protein